jgi:hypothetical protein
MPMKAEVVSFIKSPKQTSSVRRGTGNGNPPLAMLCMDQQEFELEVGHAMDVLREDYPSILTENPGR